MACVTQLVEKSDNHNNVNLDLNNNCDVTTMQKCRDGK